MSLYSFTVLVGLDELHFREWEQTSPLWRHRCPNIASAKNWIFAVDDSPFTFSYPVGSSVLIVPADKGYSSQREKMLTALVRAAAHAETDYVLKIDTDARCDAPNEFTDKWFDDSPPNHLWQAPAIIAPPWGYTKPADAIDRLDTWANQRQEFSGTEPLNLHPTPGWSRVCHKRVTGWLMFIRTDFARRCADLLAASGGRLPVPSQDTFHWYCATRWGELIRPVRFPGWSHRRVRFAKEATT